MNGDNFNRLSQENKILLVEDIGELVCSIEFYEHRVYLFSFNAMFVEVYRNIDSNEIEKIQSVNFGDLDKFLSRITLGNLIRATPIL